MPTVIDYINSTGWNGVFKVNWATISFVTVVRKSLQSSHSKAENIPMPGKSALINYLSQQTNSN